MALGSTVYHFEVDVSDVDRNVYLLLDLRLARHPSETLPYLLTRAIAYCLFYQEGIAFGPGLSEGTSMTWGASSPCSPNCADSCRRRRRRRQGPR